MDDNYKVWRFMCCNILAKGKRIDKSHLFQLSILLKLSEIVDTSGMKSIKALVL